MIWCRKAKSEYVDTVTSTETQLGAFEGGVMCLSKVTLHVVSDTTTPLPDHHQTLSPIFKFPVNTGLSFECSLYGVP